MIPKQLKNIFSRVKSSLNWYFAEFIVVVTGVLVALALNAWWQDKQNEQVEYRYLLQLERDLSASAMELKSTVSSLKRYKRSSAMLLRAFRSREIPEPDSLFNWAVTAFNISPVTPILGTAEAAISSGEIRLIRNDSLREAIPAFVSQSHALSIEAGLYTQSMISTTREAFTFLDLFGLAIKSLPPELLAKFDYVPDPGNTRDKLYMRSFSEILEDEGVYDIVSMAYLTHGNAAELGEELLNETEYILDLLKTAIEQSAT